MFVTPIPIHAVLADAVEVLDAAGVSYAVMGGFAVRALGIPRPTYDGDLLVDLDVQRSVALFPRFEESGFRIPPEFAKGYRDTLKGMEKIAIHKFQAGHDWLIDVFFPTTPLLQSAMKRRNKVAFMGKERGVLSLEDMVLLKIIAGRRKDGLDIEELLKVHRKPDLEYLRLWADRLHRSADLEKELKHAGL